MNNTVTKNCLARPYCVQAVRGLSGFLLSPLKNYSPNIETYLIVVEPKKENHTCIYQGVV